MSVAGAHSNPRVRDYLPAIESQLIDWAACPFDEFDGRVRDFVRLADAEGTEQRDTARHERRSLHLSQVGNGFAGHFGCGTTQGAPIQRVLDHVTTKEFDTDWAEAKARVGDKVTKNDLAAPASNARWMRSKRCASLPPPRLPACSRPRRW
jgi:hypothetical protein